MIKRSERLAFMEVVEGDQKVYKRLTGFTEFTLSKNPREYSRKYIDEDTERTEVIAYAPAISYKFDLEYGNLVHAFLTGIAKGEVVGEDAECNIVIVDKTKYDGQGGCEAVMRRFTVIPQTEGDDRDAYTVSGSLKAVGKTTFGKAKTTDNWQTITFEKL